MFENMTFHVGEDIVREIGVKKVLSGNGCCLVGFLPRSYLEDWVYIVNCLVGIVVELYHESTNLKKKVVLFLIK